MQWEAHYVKGLKDSTVMLQKEHKDRYKKE